MHNRLLPIYEDDVKLFSLRILSVKQPQNNVAIAVHVHLSAHFLFQVFAIKFVTFASDFVLFVVEFVTFAVEFIPFAIEFIGFANESIAFALEFITFTQEFVHDKFGSCSKHENKV